MVGPGRSPGAAMRVGRGGGRTLHRDGGNPKLRSLASRKSPTYQIIQSGRAMQHDGGLAGYGMPALDPARPAGPKRGGRTGARLRGAGGVHSAQGGAALSPREGSASRRGAVVERLRTACCVGRGGGEHAASRAPARRGAARGAASVYIAHLLHPSRWQRSAPAPTPQQRPVVASAARACQWPGVWDRPGPGRSRPGGGGPEHSTSGPGIRVRRSPGRRRTWPCPPSSGVTVTVAPPGARQAPRLGPEHRRPSRPGCRGRQAALAD